MLKKKKKKSKRRGGWRSIRHLRVNNHINSEKLKYFWWLMTMLFSCQIDSNYHIPPFARDQHFKINKMLVDVDPNEDKYEIHNNVQFWLRSLGWFLQIMFTIKRLSLLKTWLPKTSKMRRTCKVDVKTPNLSTQLAFTCSKLTKETLEQGVKYGQS